MYYAILLLFKFYHVLVLLIFSIVIVIDIVIYFRSEHSLNQIQSGMCPGNLPHNNPNNTTNRHHSRNHNKIVEFLCDRYFEIFFFFQ